MFSLFKCFLILYSLFFKDCAYVFFYSLSIMSQMKIKFSNLPFGLSQSSHGLHSFHTTNVLWVFTKQISFYHSNNKKVSKLDWHFIPQATLKCLFMLVLPTTICHLLKKSKHFVIINQRHPHFFIIKFHPLKCTNNLSLNT